MAVVELRNSTNAALRCVDCAGNANFADMPQIIAPRTTARWEVYGAGTSTFVLDGIDDFMAPRVTIGWVTTQYGTRFFAHQVGKQLRMRQGQPPHDGLFTIVMARANTMPAVIVTPTPPPATPRPSSSTQITTTNATIAPARHAYPGLPRHLGLLIPTLVVAVAAIVLSGTVTATNIRPIQAVVATVTLTATTIPATATTAPATQPAAAATPAGLAQTTTQKNQAALMPVASPTPAKSPQTPPATPTPAATPVPPTATTVPPTPTATAVPTTATPVPPGNLALNFTQAFASCVNGLFIQVTATNTGGQALTWSATATVTGGKSFASASPASGTIAAGQRAYIGVNGQGAATAVLLTITWTSAGQTQTSQVTYTCN